MGYNFYKKYIKTREDKRLSDSSGSTSKARPLEEEKPKPTLLARIGGAEALQSIVHVFYELIYQDEMLMGFFEGVDMKVVSLHQKRFLSMAFTRIPKGVSVENMIKNHHKRLFADGLSEVHFDRVSQHLVSAMKAHDLDEELVKEAVHIIAPLRKVFQQGAIEASQGTR